jgi:tetratricopeptide (TPR) repeat protein
MPAKSRIGRHLLALAESYLWLGRAELQAGRPEAIPPLHGNLAKTLEEFTGQLLVGTTLSQQAATSHDLAPVGDLVKPWLMSASATTPAERIAVQRLEVQARRSWLARQPRFAKQPDNPALRFEVAWNLAQLADLLAQDGQMPEAKAHLDEALPVLKDLAQAEPENLCWRQGLARAWEALGRVQARSGRSAEARDAAGQAVRIAEELARLDPAYWYDLACILGLRSRVSASEADAAKAIAALRRAIQAGFDNEYQLRTDPRWDGLRSRPDFPAPRGKNT